MYAVMIYYIEFYHVGYMLCKILCGANGGRRELFVHKMSAHPNFRPVHSNLISGSSSTRWAIDTEIVITNISLQCDCVLWRIYIIFYLIFYHSYQVQITLSEHLKIDMLVCKGVKLLPSVLVEGMLKTWQGKLWHSLYKYDHKVMMNL
jgi:hypothetical protein